MFLRAGAPPAPAVVVLFATTTRFGSGSSRSAAPVCPWCPIARPPMMRPRPGRRRRGRPRCPQRLQRRVRTAISGRGSAARKGRCRADVQSLAVLEHRGSGGSTPAVLAPRLPAGDQPSRRRRPYESAPPASQRGGTPRAVAASNLPSRRQDVADLLGRISPELQRHVVAQSTWAAVESQ